MHEHEGSVLSQYVDLLTSPSHWLLELTIILVLDVLIGLLLWPTIKRAIQRHDDEHHAGHTTSSGLEASDDFGAMAATALALDLLDTAMMEGWSPSVRDALRVEFTRAWLEDTSAAT